MFIDKSKYFRQSLAVLANTMTDKKKRVKNECKKFIIKDTKLNKKFKECSVDNQNGF